MAKGEKKSKKKGPKRTELRFVPEGSQNRTLVSALGALGSAALGAGMYGQLYAKYIVIPEGQTVNPMMALTIGGAAFVMGAVWLGTSADASVRVGAPGVALEKSGDVKRIPWHSLSRVEWDESARVLELRGKDEGGGELTLRVSAKTNPMAIAWILQEATERAKDAIEKLPEDLIERLPEPNSMLGEKIDLEPMQVVGRRCAVSNEIIGYEPDAKVCPRCERVYHRKHVPSACACGEELEAAPAGDDLAAAAATA